MNFFSQIYEIFLVKSNLFSIPLNLVPFNTKNATSSNDFYIAPKAPAEQEGKL